MSHANPNNPYGGGPHGGNPFGPGGQQPVQHRRDCREPLRNPCQNPCNDDGDSEIVDAFSEMSGGGGGSGGGRGGGRDGAGGDRPYDNGPSGDPVPNTGSGGSGQGGGGGGKDGCGCMPGGGGGRGGGGGGRGGGSGGGGDGCGCDGCLIVMVLTLPFVALWSVLRALVGKRPVRPDTPAKPLSTVDSVLPNGRAARTMFRAVRWYRRNVSPRRAAPVCRYTPSCSTYAATSLQRHGAWRGGRMTLRRLSRCNRSHPGGHDPVPEAGAVR
ncbi:membrane protein insertion efficiency factor YidD [Streptodolium elevatio]|uniref:Putative membrane protein insertion efficiency factor n=1 Tax=Streptodolium elevatio TaxID=3157996 RepID=A0ABV3DN49_9ACTN